MFLFCFIFYQITSFNNATVIDKNISKIYKLFISAVSIIYTNIQLRKFVDDICYLHKKAPTTIMMIGVSIVIFRGNSSSELNLSF